MVVTDCRLSTPPVGLLMQSPSDASVDEVPQGDLDTAKLYGKRIAGIAARLRG